MAALAALGLVPAAVAALDPAATSAALAWNLALLLGFLVDHRAARATPVRLERGRDRRLSVGEPNRVRLKLTSWSPRGLHVRVVDRPPPDVRVEGVAGAGLRLRPFGRQEVTYSLTPLRRGEHRFAGARLAVRGPLGLAWAETEAAPAEDVRAVPGLLALKRLRLAARHRDAVRYGFRAVRRAGAGDEFEHLRDYSPDDEVRRIDWKATARRGRPITRVYEAERSQNVVLAVDCGRTMVGRCGDTTRLDLAIQAALVLASSKNGMAAVRPRGLSFSEPQRIGCAC